MHCPCSAFCAWQFRATSTPWSCHLKHAHFNSITFNYRPQPPAAEKPDDQSKELPDEVIMAMLKQEVLLTGAKLHGLCYDQIMGERKLRSLKTQLRQVLLLSYLLSKVLYSVMITTCPIQEQSASLSTCLQCRASTTHCWSASMFRLLQCIRPSSPALSFGDEHIYHSCFDCGLSEV